VSALGSPLTACGRAEAGSAIPLIYRAMTLWRRLLGDTLNLAVFNEVVIEVSAANADSS
jgi:hypothetical protein